MKALGLCAALGLGLSASACGMNSGTASAKTNQNNEVLTDYPIETAMLNIYTKERNQELVSVVGEQKMVITNSIIPKSSSVFEEKHVQSAEKNTLIETDHHVVMNLSRIHYFTLAPLVFHGFIDSSDEYSVATQTTPIPKTANIDDSSTYLTEQVYSDSSKRQKIKTYTQTWSLKRESNNTAWLCIESSENLLLSYDPDGTSTECYKINAKGDVLDSNVTINGDETILFNSL